MTTKHPFPVVPGREGEQYPAYISLNRIVEILREAGVAIREDAEIVKARLLQGDTLHVTFEYPKKREGPLAQDEVDFLLVPVEKMREPGVK